MNPTGSAFGYAPTMPKARRSEVVVAQRRSGMDQTRPVAELGSRDRIEGTGRILRRSSQEQCKGLLEESTQEEPIDNGAKSGGGGGSGS